MLLTSNIFYNDYILRDFYCEGFIGNVFITKLDELCFEDFGQKCRQEEFSQTLLWPPLNVTMSLKTFKCLALLSGVKPSQAEPLHVLKKGPILLAVRTTSATGRSPVETLALPLLLHRVEYFFFLNIETDVGTNCTNWHCTPLGPQQQTLQVWNRSDEQLWKYTDHRKKYYTNNNADS